MAGLNQSETCPCNSRGRPPPNRQTSMSSPSYASLAALIVDPSPHMCALVTSMLRHLKLKSVEDAQSSDHALAALQHRRFGVILIDDVLGPLDGVEVTRLLRQTADGLNRDTPVIMMSARPDLTRIAAARDAGIHEFLRKPFAAAHVATRLDAILVAPRPFIENKAYIGPDRRRRSLKPPGEERRHEPGETQAVDGDGAATASSAISPQR